MQPRYVPPNVRFEIDNAEDEWMFGENTFDFIHIRTLLGSIKDWDRLYRQAYRALKPVSTCLSCETAFYSSPCHLKYLSPIGHLLTLSRFKGGWIEHHDNSCKWGSEHGEFPSTSALGQWHEVIYKAGELMGQTMKILEDDIQQPGMERAGFVNVDKKDFRAPFGSWPRDRHLKTMGALQWAAWDEDPEGM